MECTSVAIHYQMKATDHHIFFVETYAFFLQLQTLVKSQPLEEEVLTLLFLSGE